jgi:hypothetical protein
MQYIDFEALDSSASVHRTPLPVLLCLVECSPAIRRPPIHSILFYYRCREGYALVLRATRRRTLRLSTRIVCGIAGSDILRRTVNDVTTTLVYILDFSLDLRSIYRFLKESRRD